MSTSRSLNKVMLIGNLTRDPVLKGTNSGSKVCTFGIATNTTWKDTEGGLQERTEFHNIVAWNKLAEICAQILATGMLVYVEGELRTRVWDDENGVRHYRTEVKIDDMKLLDNKDKAGAGAQLQETEEVESSEKSDTKEEKEDVKEQKEEKDDDDDDEKEEHGEDEDEIEKEAEDLF